jgi:peptidoglycan/xylan/chitin deacetylase (PgdA/CDA1 family)
MHIFRWIGVSLSLLLLSSAVAFSQNRTVAMTVDDLPYAAADDGSGLLPADQGTAERVNRRLLTAFHRHHISATGFVIQQGVEKLGAAAGTEILAQWTRGGFDLGNHTYSHPDINTLSVAQIEEEIVKGEMTFAPLMK